MSDVAPKVPNMNPRQISGARAPQTTPRPGAHFAPGKAVETGTGFGTHYGPPSAPPAPAGPVSTGHVAPVSRPAFDHRNGMGTEHVNEGVSEVTEPLPGHPASSGTHTSPSTPPMHEKQFGRQAGSSMTARLKMFSDLAHGKNPGHVLGLAAGVHKSPETFSAYQRAGGSLPGMHKQLERDQQREAEHQERLGWARERHGWAGERHETTQANAGLRGARQMQTYEHAEELHPHKVRSAAANAEAAEARAGTTKAAGAHRVSQAAASASAAQSRARSAAATAAGQEKIAQHRVGAAEELKNAAAQRTLHAAELTNQLERRGEQGEERHNVRMSTLGHQRKAAKERSRLAAFRTAQAMSKAE